MEKSEAYFAVKNHKDDRTRICRGQRDPAKMEKAATCSNMWSRHLIDRTNVKSIN